MHARIAERIVSVAQLPQSATVFEIGPGRGILTRALLKAVSASAGGGSASGGRVIAVEADKTLFEKLRVDFADEINDKRLDLVHGDVRDYHYPQNYAVAQKWGYRAQRREYHVVANIPYYLTGELFRMLLSAEHQPSSMTLLVQKEVAERISRSKKESILSLSVKAYGVPKYAFTVPRGAFRPAPNVDSAVLTLRDISRRHFSSPEEEKRFFALIHAGFAHKRKFVWKNLSKLVPEETLRAAHVSPTARAEDLSLSDWLTLAKIR